MASRRICGKLYASRNTGWHAMRLRVIEGGLVAADQRGRGAESRRPDSEDVRREAARRLGASGYNRSRVMEFAAGVPMPAVLKYLAMQINFAAEAISRLDPIPVDYHSDLYWPKIDDITTA